MRIKKKKHGAERLEACGDIVIKNLIIINNHTIHNTDNIITYIGIANNITAK